MKKKSRASLIDFVTVLLTLLAFLAILTAFFRVAELLQVRMDISQVSRRYVLSMETKGYLTEEDRRELEEELTVLGLSEIDLTGTTLSPVHYGESIVLHVRGRIGGNQQRADEGWPPVWAEDEYEVEEKRKSTAKN